MANWWRDYKAAHPEVAALKEFKRDRHAIHLRKSPTEIECHISPVPAFYKNGEQWEEIDTANVQDDGQFFYSPGIPVKIRKSDLRVFTDDLSYSQLTTRVGRFDPVSREILQHWDVPLGTRDGDTFTAVRGIFVHQVQIMPSGVRERIILNSLPDTLRPGEYFVFDTVVTGVSLPNGKLESFVHDGKSFPFPSVWGSDGRDIPAKRYARTINGVQHIFTGVAYEDLEGAPWPVVIDPDFSASTANFHRVLSQVYGNYSGARTTSTGQDDTDLWVGQRFYLLFYGVHRTFIKFDTSSIPAGSTINQVNMKLAVTTDASSTDFNLDIVKYDWSGTDPIGTGNRETAFDGALSATKDVTWRSTSGMSTNTYYTSPNMDTAWVELAGTTYYALRSQEDYNASAPSGDEYVIIDNPSGTKPPVLVVDYTIPGGGVLFFPF